MSSAESNEKNTRSWMLSSDGTWANAWKISAAVGLVGLAGTAFGFSTDADHAWYSYLFGIMSILTIAFGALFMVIIQHLTAGHWGVTTRRMPELIASGVPVLALFFAPILVTTAMGHNPLYEEWIAASHHGEHAEHAEASEGEGDEHAEPEGGHGEGEEHGEGHGAGAHSPQQEVLHHEVLGAKSGYLNTTRWASFAVIYFLVWIGIGLFYFRTSVKQDEDGDFQHTNRMKGMAPLAATLFGLSLTFAAFDWMMALEPAWYSTIFGVVIFGGSSCAILAIMVAWGISLHRAGEVGDAMNVENFHDIGRLLFGFCCFWAYTGFSQWMLIWYAGIPEEATFFQHRWHNGWQVVSVVLILGHWVAPFFLTMSRIFKRNLPFAQFMALWVLGFHVLDVYWYIMPNYTDAAGSNAVGSNVLVDASALLAVGGVFFAYVFFMMRKVSLVPTNDPRLERCLHHHQTY